MSATTYIRTPARPVASHLDQPDPQGPHPQGGVDEAPHPALHLAHRRPDPGPGHRLQRRRGLLRDQPVAHHDGPAAPGIRPDQRLDERGHDRRGGPRGARRADGHRGVLDRDDPVHLQRHARQTARAGGQGRHHGRVRVPRDAARQRRRLRTRPADIRRPARRGDHRTSRRASGHVLRSRGREPRRRHRRGYRRPHPAHRGSGHHPGADHHRGTHRRPVPSGRAGVSTCPASPLRRP